MENLSGKPLARTTVVLEPVAGTPGTIQSARADVSGAFQFGALPKGAYLLKASRLGFMPVEYGQKRWNSAAKPIMVEEEASLFVSIRMFRYSAILGTVMDENYVGLPNHEVAAYRTTRPLRLVAQGVTDDRGIYRLAGLEPGNYVVRTSGKLYDDESYLATFSKETDRLDQAHTVNLLPEQEAGYMDVRPMHGLLYTLSVAVGRIPLGAEIAITIASDMGRKTVKARTFQFTALPAAEYDVYAEVTNGVGGSPPLAAYQRLQLGRDSGITLLLQEGTSVMIAEAPAGSPGKLWFRRADLAGAGEAVAPPITDNKAGISAGRWEIMLDPPSGYYVSSMAAPGITPAHSRVDSWNEVVTRTGSVRFTLSAGPCVVRGTVKSAGEPVNGAPVFLEAYDPATRKRDGELRATRADIRGQYHFDGLPPGTYRILGTFEYLAPEQEAMDAANAPSLTLDPHGQIAKDLELYVIP